MQLTKRYTVVLAYVRVSGEGQYRDGTSPEAQEDAHRRFCATHGLPEPLIFVEVESATSAKTEARIVQARVQAQAQRGTLVITTVVDRWSRDIVHGVSTIRALVHRGVGFIAHREEIDASTVRGAEDLAQRVLDAQREHQRIWERTVLTRQALAAQGIYCQGTVPFGYHREVRREQGRKIKRLVVAPGEALIVRFAFELAASGHSILDIVGRLPSPPQERRVRWDRHAVLWMLRHRLYLGEVRTGGDTRQQSAGIRGTWIAGQHEAIIPRDLWERAHAGLASRKLAGRQPTEDALTASWLLRGLAVCADCGAKMTGAYGGSRSAGPGYYVCRGRVAWRRPGEQATCKAPYIRVDAADASVEELVLARLVELRDELARARPTVPAPPPARDFDGERALLKARRSRVLDLAEHGRIEGHELDRRLATIEEEVGRLELAAATADRAARAQETAQSPERRARLSDSLDEVARAWTAMPRPAQRDAVRILTTSIALAHGQAPAIVWRTVDELFLERDAAPPR